MKKLKLAILVSTLAATTVALAQSVTPQTKQAQAPAQTQKVAATAGNASGGQTSGVQAPFGSIGGLGAAATLAVVAAVVVVVAVAASDEDAPAPATTHK